MDRRRAGTVVRADGRAVAHDGTAQVRRIGYGDVRRASDRWQLRVAYRDREGTSGGVARAVRYLEGVCCCADRERRTGRQARRLESSLTGTIVRTNRCSVAHNSAAQVRIVVFSNIGWASNCWEYIINHRHGSRAGAVVSMSVVHRQRDRVRAEVAAVEGAGHDGHLVHGAAVVRAALEYITRGNTARTGGVEVHRRGLAD